MSDREVRAHAERGISCIDELGEHCDAAQLCGGCRPTVERLLTLHGAHGAMLTG